MKKVAVIDSGSGGINVLKSAFASAHGCQFLYLADDAHSPYGNKSKSELIEIGAHLVSFLQSFFAPDIVIVACNTLTSAALPTLRKRFSNIKFIGCEPALKPACKSYKQEEVLLLATPVTIKYNRLINMYPHVRTLAIDNLPKLIDENLGQLDVLTPLLAENIQPFQPNAIVLGCTHFEGIKKQIASFSQAQLFSSSDGIARQLNKFATDEGGNDVSFMSTGDGETLGKYFHYFIS